MKHSLFLNSNYGKKSKLILLSILLIFISGCSGLSNQRSASNTTSSSLANFLYPDKQTKVVQAKQIHRSLYQAKIGLAFLPSKHVAWCGFK